MSYSIHVPYDISISNTVLFPPFFILCTFGNWTKTPAHASQVYYHLPLSPARFPTRLRTQAEYFLNQLISATAMRFALPMDMGMSVCRYSWIRYVRASGQFSVFSSSASSNNSISKTMVTTACSIKSPLSGMDQEWKEIFGRVSELCFFVWGLVCIEHRFSVQAKSFTCSLIEWIYPDLWRKVLSNILSDSKISTTWYIHRATHNCRYRLLRTLFCFHSLYLKLTV